MAGDEIYIEGIRSKSENRLRVRHAAISVIGGQTAHPLMTVNAG
jgi:hypothetical protein